MSCHMRGYVSCHMMGVGVTSHEMHDFTNRNQSKKTNFSHNTVTTGRINFLDNGAYKSRYVNQIRNLKCCF